MKQAMMARKNPVCITVWFLLYLLCAALVVIQGQCLTSQDHSEYCISNSTIFTTTVTRNKYDNIYGIAPITPPNAAFQTMTEIPKGDHSSTISGPCDNCSTTGTSRFGDPRIIIFGGVQGNPRTTDINIYNDVYVLDLELNRWFQPEHEACSNHEDCIPKKRAMHTATSIQFGNINYMLVHGGYTIEDDAKLHSLNDMWLLNVTKLQQTYRLQWIPVHLDSTSPLSSVPARFGHIAVKPHQTNDSLSGVLLFGGAQWLTGSTLLQQTTIIPRTDLFDQVLLLRLTSVTETGATAMLKVFGTSRYPKGFLRRAFGYSAVVHNTSIMIGGGWHPGVNETAFPDSGVHASKDWGVLDVLTGIWTIGEFDRFRSMYSSAVAIEGPDGESYVRVFGGATFGSSPAVVVFLGTHDVNKPNLETNKILQIDVDCLVQGNSDCHAPLRYRDSALIPNLGGPFDVPSPRMGSSTAYLNVEELFLLFGGVNNYGWIFFDSLWASPVGIQQVQRPYVPFHEINYDRSATPLSRNGAAAVTVHKLQHTASQQKCCEKAFVTLLGGLTVDYHRNAELWRFSFQNDDNRGQWVFVNMVAATTSEDVIPATVDHTVVAFKEELLMFGGEHITPNGEKVTTNALYSVQLNQNQMETALDLAAVSMLLYGGSGSSSSTFGPTRRKAHSSEYINCKLWKQPCQTPDILAEALLIFGGTDNHHGYNDIWIWSIPEPERKWYRFACAGKGKCPTKRYHQSAGIIDDHLYIFGGRESETGKYLDDLWQINVRSLKRSTKVYTATNLKVDHHGSWPEQRFSASFISAGNTLLLFGGSRNNSASPFLSDAWIFQEVSSARRPEWLKLSDDTGHALSATASAFLPTGRSTGMVMSNGGYSSAQLNSSNSNMISRFMRVGCPLNHEATIFGEDPCVECGKTSYTVAIGKPCIACPTGLQRSDNDTDSQSKCTMCIPHFCGEHGHCVRLDEHAVCKCHRAYSGDRCDRASLLLIVSITMGLLTIALVITFFVYYYWRVIPRNKLLAVSAQLGRAENTLKERFLIDPKELHDLSNPLAQGSFGWVVKGTWKGMLVAIKISKLSLEYCDELLMKEFANEGKLVSQLSHPNIVFYLGAGIFDDRHINYKRRQFLVMQYCAYGSLRRILKDDSQQLSGYQRLQFACDIASGLLYLHTLDPPLLHRDLKSDNVLVDQDWTCKLTDFGESRNIEKRMNQRTRAVQQRGRAVTKTVKQMARYLPGHSSTSSLREPLMTENSPEMGMEMTTYGGTPAYAAPEVDKGKPYTEKSDIYSLGMVFYELLSRKDPFYDFECNQFKFRPSIQAGKLPTIITKDLWWLKEGINSDFPHLIVECWHFEGWRRPKLKKIVKRLQTTKNLQDPEDATSC